MSPPHTRCTVALDEAMAALPAEGGSRFATLFRHGSLEVEIYAPRGVDLQTPHSRDEVYVVAKGSGVYLHGGERTPFGPGDFLFAPAGLEHRFVDFSDDLSVWVLFYGPEGGEISGPEGGEISGPEGGETSGPEGGERPGEAADG